MRTIYVVTAFACMVSASAASSADVLPTRTIAVSTPNLFVGAAGTDLNNAGQVAFYGLSFAPDGTFVVGPFVSDPVGGLLAPPTTGADIVGLNPDEVLGGDPSESRGTFDLSETGRLTFFGDVLDADVPVGSAVVSGDADNGFGVTIRSGDQIDGAPAGTVFNRIDRSGIVGNRVGGTLLLAEASDGVGNRREAILRDVDGSGYTAVAVEGQQVPGLSSGVEFENFSLVNGSLNDDGRVAFRARLGGPGVNGPNEQALFTDRDGAGVSLVARSGQQAEGFASGVVYRGFGFTPTLSTDGDINALTLLQGPGVNNSNDVAILKFGMDGGVDVLARHGDPAPGFDPGVVFSDFIGNHVSNDAGDVAFLSTLTDSVSDTFEGLGLFLASDDGDDEIAIAVTGQEAPGFDDGSVLTFIESDSLALNNAGQVAFIGSTTEVRKSLFATDPSGELLLIATEGSVIDVSDDPMAPDFRTVSILDSIFDEEPDFSLNDRGEIAFFAQFTDGTSGIFVTKIPAPGSGVLLAAGGCIAVTRRRRGGSGG